MGDPWAKLLGAAIESRKSKLGTLSKYLWDNPELALKEFKAHDYLTTFLEAEGFSVQRHYILETAFRAEYSTTDEPKGMAHIFINSIHPKLSFFHYRKGCATLKHH